MKLLYKPFSVIARGVAARLGRTAFEELWARVGDGEPPAATVEDASLARVIEAAVLEAATMAAFAALADRAAAEAFRYLFGAWPGDGKSGG